MTEAGLGVCAYCVVAADAQPSLAGVVGVDPDFGVQLLTHADLGVLVSRVRLEEFGAQALRRNLEDLDWLERTARRHDAVLARALATDAVVPLRLCTVFTDTASVRDMLDREGGALGEAMARVRGRVEWSVKVLADARRLEQAAREEEPGREAAPEESPGRAFFARRKREREARDEAHAMAAAAAEEVHARLREEAAAATLLAPQRPELSGRRGEMLLNGAYLVDRPRTDRFAAVVDELGERRRGVGVDIELSGPWAPYNFVTARGDER